MDKDQALEALQTASEPLGLFAAWLKDAETSEPNDPNAAALATATPDGDPSVRIVLVKRSDARGFWFFSNAESQKGGELAENPRAALCFHWKTLRRQVRVAGRISPLPDAEVDNYFHSRGRRSQLGAAVSKQSRPLGSREELEQAVARFTAEHPPESGEVPRPESWRGYCLEPERMEFWMDGPDRLHDRLLFTRSREAWSKARLWP